MSTPIIRIPLHSNKYPGLVALVDAVDYPLVSSYHWQAVKDGQTFYAVRMWQEGSKRRERVTHTMRMHRQLLNAAPDVIVDHRDGDGLNNTRANLRVCSTAQNLANRRKSVTNTSGYRGVSFFMRTGRWKSSIHHAGQSLHLGYHATPEAAARAYDAAALRLRGEYAQLNFPDQTNE